MKVKVTDELVEFGLEAGSLAELRAIVTATAELPHDSTFRVVCRFEFDRNGSRVRVLRVVLPDADPAEVVEQVQRGLFEQIDQLGQRRRKRET